MAHIASHEALEDHKQMSVKSNGHGITGYLNLFANGIDNFTHGLAVAASFLAGTKVCVQYCITIVA